MDINVDTAWKIIHNQGIKTGTVLVLDLSSVGGGDPIELYSVFGIMRLFSIVLSSTLTLPSSLCTTLHGLSF